MELQNVIIHARFAPNGAVVEISERPAELSPQDWFFFLSGKAGNAYQALSWWARRVSADTGGCR